MMKRIRIFMPVGKIWNAALLVAVLAAGVVRAEDANLSDLTLVGLANTDGVIYASLYDARNGEHFLTSTKAATHGVELVGVNDYDSATVRQHGRSLLLHLDWSAGTNEVTDTAVTLQNIPMPGSVEATTPKPPPGRRLPLVFQSGDLKGFNLTDHQKAVVLGLRQQFLAAVGAAPASSVTSTPASDANTASGPGQSVGNGGDTAAPASRSDAWESAQEQSDDMFRMLFGYQAFNLYQMGLIPKPSR